MSCVSAKTTEAATPSARYTIINLLEKAGHTLGLSCSMIEHLAYLVRHTQEVDWQPGNSAIVYKTVTLMARDNRISERQIHNRERELIDALNLEHAPSGNFRRRGNRDKTTGRIIWAFGIDITALRNHLPALKSALAAEEVAEERWRERKQELSGLKGRIRKLMHAATTCGLSDAAEALQASHPAYLGRVRAETPTEEIERRILCARILKDALERTLVLGKTAEQPMKTSDVAELKFRHIDSSIDLHTNDKSFGGNPGVNKCGQDQREKRLRSIKPFPLSPHPAIPETYLIDFAQSSRANRIGIRLQSYPFTALPRTGPTFTHTNNFSDKRNQTVLYCDKNTTMLANHQLPFSVKIEFCFGQYIQSKPIFSKNALLRSFAEERTSLNDEISMNML